jgi:hypothetical protein
MAIIMRYHRLNHSVIRAAKIANLNRSQILDDFFVVAGILLRVGSGELAEDERLFRRLSEREDETGQEVSWLRVVDRLTGDTLRPTKLLDRR